VAIPVSKGLQLVALHRRRRELTPELREVVAERLSQWTSLTVVERQRLERVAADLIDRVSWEASRDFVLDDTVRGTIAGHAALLAVGLPDPVFPLVHAIVVHPGTITMSGPRAGPIPGTVEDHPLPVLGHTSARGPVFIAWGVAQRQAQHPESGHNVVLHEFAHMLDAEDGTLDGTPRLRHPEQRDQWISVCRHHFDVLRQGNGDGLLSDYAATRPSEFFAVCTEVFFTRGVELLEKSPDLYEVFRDYYGQDPARWGLHL
jgi:Mlc titration factor MtfA (ptsG expression regulator)